MDVEPGYQNITPENDQKHSEPAAAPPEDPVVNVKNAEIYAQAEENKRLRKYALMTMFLSLAIISLIIAVLTVLGDRSQVYDYVQGLSSMANLLILPAAAITGGGFAYIIAHPKRVKNPAAPHLSANVGLVILGFFFGVIPGLFWVLIISYPLSNHACELSGSKYC